MSKVLLGMPTLPPPSPRGVGNLRGEESFPAAARHELQNQQLRRNLGNATATIRAKRAQVVGEVVDWEELREAGRQLKVHTMAHLEEYLVQLEEAVTARGGVVHWARDAAEANRIAIDLVRAKGVDEVVKVKSMATQEIGLNEALRGRRALPLLETDLAELIVQLGHDKPSHILVPAIHRNRAEIREIFLREMPDVDPGLTDEPAALAAAARRHLRAQVPLGQGRDQRRQLRGGRVRNPCGGGIRGQRADVPDPAGDLDHDHGHREARAPLARSRGVPAVASRAPRPASG